MKNTDLNKLLKEVIIEAREADIPVPFNIDEEVKINKRAKKRFGCCHKKEGMYIIEVSEFILDCSEEKIRETLAHEILHTCDRCFNHGSLWKSYANKMNGRYGYNIMRISPYEHLNINEVKVKKREYNIRYVITCTKCGSVFYRSKRTRVVQNINNYRCKCGGKLVLKEL